MNIVSILFIYQVEIIFLVFCICRIKTAFKEGEEYMVEKNMRCPEGFCNYAWKDIFSDVRVLALGGDFEPWVEKPKMILCCTDGIRPVSFTLLRVDD